MKSTDNGADVDGFSYVEIEGEMGTVPLGDMRQVHRVQDAQEARQGGGRRLSVTISSHHSFSGVIALKVSNVAPKCFLQTFMRQ